MQKNNICGECYWKYNCECLLEGETCDHFDLEDKDNDEYISKYIEEQKQEFYKEWKSYIRKGGLYR